MHHLPIPSARIAGVLLGAALLLGACSASGSTSAPSAAASGSAASSGAAASGSAGSGAGGASATIIDNAFQPTSITVKAGSTVTWKNTGSGTHTVTAGDGSFDSGQVAAGSSFQHTFATAGTFAYHCTIHSSMTGTVVVTP